MNIGNTSGIVSFVMVACLLAGCAEVPQDSDGTKAATVKVYAPAQLAPSQYETVRDLWVDSWHAAFWLPSSTSEAAGVAALQTEAARLGANGLINVSCMDQGHPWWSRSSSPDFVCYASAIRVRASR